MKDGLLRRMIKRVALLRYTINLKTTRAIKHQNDEPHFILKGSCQGCGKCCEAPGIPVRPLFFRLTTTRWLILTWHRVINGFEFLKEDSKSHTFIFTCTHFDPETKRCDSYESRPGLCRDYPRNLLDAANPDLFPECGFRAVHKNAERFRESLSKRDLTPEQLKEIEDKLHLKEPPE